MKNNRSKKIVCVMAVFSIISLCLYSLPFVDILKMNEIKITYAKSVSKSHDFNSVKKTVSADASTEKSETKKPKVIPGLQKKVKKKIKSSGLKSNKVSIYVENLKTGNYINMDKGSVRAASLIKLYVAGAVYDQFYNGKLKGKNEKEIHSLVKKMITVSDNASCNALVKMLGNSNANAGMSVVNSYCAKYGFAATSMGRLMLDFSSQKDNYTSAFDCCYFLRLISKKKLPGSKRILSYLKKQTRTSKIPAGVPKGVKTANKTGELNDTENDAAIVYKTGKTYTICVMVTPAANTACARKLITDISKEVYDNMK